MDRGFLSLSGALKKQKLEVSRRCSDWLHPNPRYPLTIGRKLRTRYYFVLPLGVFFFFRGLFSDLSRTRLIYSVLHSPVPRRDSSASVDRQAHAHDRRVRYCGTPVTCFPLSVRRRPSRWRREDSTSGRSSAKGRGIRRMRSLPLSAASR